MFRNKDYLQRFRLGTSGVGSVFIWYMLLFSFIDSVFARLYFRKEYNVKTLCCCCLV